MGDLLDDLISISKSFDSMKKELTDASDELLGKKPAGSRDEWDPLSYREEPTTHPYACVACIDEKATCRRCVDVCPTDSIRFEDGGIDILKDCRRCGLCVAVCPTLGLSSARYAVGDLYSRVGAIAATGKAAYVTCPRALKKKPDEAMVVVPCVGVFPPELWASLLMEYPNISVYLPLGICDECKTVTGEDTYSLAIEKGEVWSGVNLGYEIDESDLQLEKKRSAERREFVDNFMKKAGMTAVKTNPLTAGLARAYDKLDAHRAAFRNIDRLFDKLEGKTEIKRSLTAKRRLLLVALQQNPERLEHVELFYPVVDEEKCTAGQGCTVCFDLCPTKAIAVQDDQVSVSAPHCVACDLCVDVCPESALSLKESNFLEVASELRKLSQDLK